MAWLHLAVSLLSATVAVSAQSDQVHVAPKGQGTARELVIPEDFAAFLELLKTVQSVDLRETPESATRAAVTLRADSQRGLLNGLRGLEPTGSVCCRGLEHQLEFLLGSGRFMIARLSESVSGGTNVDLVLKNRRLRAGTDTLDDVLAPYIEQLREPPALRLRGRVALQEFAATLAAKSVIALELEAVHAADLDLLQGMPKLRALDVAQSPLRGPDLRSADFRSHLRTLTINANQVGDSDWLREFVSLDTLRVSAPTAPRGGQEVLMERDCLGCHQPKNKAGKVVRPASGAYAGLFATRRVRNLEVLGVALDPAFCQLIGSLPFLETLDLSDCDLKALDVVTLGRLQSLRRLRLDRCDGVNVADLELLQRHGKLRQLYARQVGGEVSASMEQGFDHCDVRF
jgi:hypothetical protein